MKRLKLKFTSEQTERRLDYPNGTSVGILASEHAVESMSERVPAYGVQSGTYQSRFAPNESVSRAPASQQRSSSPFSKRPACEEKRCAFVYVWHHIALNRFTRHAHASFAYSHSPLTASSRTHTPSPVNCNSLALPVAGLPCTLFRRGLVTGNRNLPARSRCSLACPRVGVATVAACLLSPVLASRFMLQHSALASYTLQRSVMAVRRAFSEGELRLP